ncbi:hypothetical protein BS78_02G159900 [Paspalum vaginatum]|nr:hypothetical protein BS78_02G159900 [Paspalum vaginatum]
MHSTQIWITRWCHDPRWCPNLWIDDGVPWYSPQGAWWQRTSGPCSILLGGAITATFLWRPVRPRMPPVMAHLGPLASSSPVVASPSSGERMGPSLPFWSWGASTPDGWRLADLGRHDVLGSPVSPLAWRISGNFHRQRADGSPVRR